MARLQPSKRLAPDGAYGEHINGYAGDGKERFLRDAQTVLREVARHLRRHGLTEHQIRFNRAGPAVSGEVTAWYWGPAEATRRVMAEMSASAVGWGRKDAVIVLARVETFEPRSGRAAPGWRRAGPGGPNQWLSANLDSDELAERLWRIFCPETTPRSVTACTSEGECAIPEPIVSSPEEALVQAEGMHRVAALFGQDNDAACQARESSQQFSLFPPSDPLEDPA